MTSTPFLKEIAQILIRPGEYDLASTCVVFPNKRARLYLSKYIGEITDKPVWAPRYLAISEMMEKISGYTIGDRLTLIFELYRAYQRVTGTNESFDTFFPYSETILADFDEIDKYLVDADDIFQNLAGLKDLDGRFNYLTDDQLTLINRFWKTFTPDQFTSGQSLFISIWDALPKVYHAFRQQLEEKGIAYEGMAYRKAIGADMKASFPNISRFLFVGFNALNKCEETLFRSLKNQEVAEFFWDYDEWYINNSIHEAGYFIRQNLKNFPPSRDIRHDHLQTGSKNILFIPVASNSGQATVLPEVFKQFGISGPRDTEDSALVLADESLLLTALYAIPESVEEINVTMGYPLAGSAVFSLIDSLYELLRNCRKTKQGSVKWYFKDILSVMSNPLLKNLYVEAIENVRKVALKQHLSYLELSGLLPEHDFLFNGNLHNNTCEYLLEVITSVIRGLPQGKNGPKSDPVHIELLFQVYTFLIRMKDVINEQQTMPGQDVLFRLIRKMLRQMHIPFNGEPLAGLQLLGILETRTLDFNNVVILSANEGVLPGSSEKPSFIPYNLRSGFGMPTPEFHDAIYAYYFYRLIQRAQNIALIYDASSGGMRTGERSRFLHQLYYEMRLPVKELHLESGIEQIRIKPVRFEKTGDVIIMLNNYTGTQPKTLSPSAINEFLNCPVRFYFHYIKRLPQPEEITEEVDSRLFGTILHHTLKTIYDDLGTQAITEDKIASLLTNKETIHNALDAAFSEVISGSKTTLDRVPEGYNLIVWQVIYTYVRKFLSKEAASCPFSIVALEESFKTGITIHVNGKPVQLSVGGIIDRIDRQGGVTRILDYKTGKPKDKFSDLESLFDSSIERNDAVFQILLYSWVYSNLFPDATVMPGLIFFRQIHDDNYSARIKMGKGELIDFNGVKKDFEVLFISALERLFDVNIPFEQTVNLKTCGYCPYKMICRR